MDRLNSYGLIQDVDVIVRQTANQLNSLESDLHNSGYHDYSRAVSNLRHRFEKALDKLMEELAQYE